MNPIQREEFEHPNYGWVATEANIDRHVGDLAEALQRWEERDRERPQSHYGAALHLELAARNLSADMAQLARLSRLLGDEHL